MYYAIYQSQTFGGNLMTELSNLPNIGKVLEENLRKIGVTTEEQFKEKGAE
ncbi:hypothetical protein RV08_GL001458 [Enterococcus mundtii]|uniref:TfoX C-terminal domain-containing protein n=1 Tax=Enterococcus mundtii TaxID=53346 RepID=A0ABQ0VIF6_ENTMU|nr:hypothetical protein RV08_GL001458 [Enterococcus mundtii]GEL81103.1 hypothetical protein EMU01_22470 [Enterococcus mundtii]GEN19331.1 hypothetical protein LAC02_26120 [Ligilactobacillus acidipiscis]